MKSRNNEVISLLTCDLVLALEVDGDVDGAAGAEVVLVEHLVLQLDVGVAVAEARDVRHLVLVERQQLVPLGVLQLHDVEHALDLGRHALVHNLLKWRMSGE